MMKLRNLNSVKKCTKCTFLAVNRSLPAEATWCLISVAESWLPATPHPGLSGADFITGFKREQVNSLPLGKMETGNPVTRFPAKAGQGVADSGGRPGRSSDEAFPPKRTSVMRVEHTANVRGTFEQGGGMVAYWGFKQTTTERNFRMTDYAAS